MRQALYTVCFIAGAILAGCMPAGAQEQSSATRDKIVFFFSQSCHNCHDVKEGILSLVARDYRGRVAIEYLDIGDIENYKQLLGIRRHMNLSGDLQVPAVYYAGRLLIGRSKIENTLLPLIRQSSLAAPQAADSAQRPPQINLVQHFLSFTPVAVTGAGLIDGINPCAFTVIVFFISFLSLQGYSRKELALIGTGFIVAVFLTYLLLGLGLFSFFYSFRGVLFVRRLLNVVIGVFTLWLGTLALYDIAKFVRTGSTEGMILQLPAAVKRQIQNVIGLAYRRNRGASQGEGRFSFFAILSTALVTGFLVSLLEAVCTGQVYLPTITYVLKTSDLRLQAAGYLVLYNVMFVVPLIVVFLFALAGVTSGEFGKFLQRHFLLTKSLLAAMFFMLGIFLLWRG